MTDRNAASPTVELVEPAAETKPDRFPVLRTRCCDECGEKYGMKRETSRFCSTACRMKFHKRRSERGAELYDLMMSNRFEREDAKTEEVWTILARLCGAYRDADKAIRSGRKSWRPLREALLDLPLSYGSEGDNR